MSHNDKRKSWCLTHERIQTYPIQGRTTFDNTDETCDFLSYDLKRVTSTEPYGKCNLVPALIVVLDEIEGTECRHCTSGQMNSGMHFPDIIFYYTCWHCNGTNKELALPDKVEI